VQGYRAEGTEELNKETAKDVKDAAIIAAAQRVERHEIDKYGTA
jgi:ferritin-like metal-binding protein YciE